jgi:hypothetical protein
MPDSKNACSLTNAGGYMSHVRCLRCHILGLIGGIKTAPVPFQRSWKKDAEIVRKVGLPHIGHNLIKNRCP